MCGACGRQIRPDRTLGAVRTLRQHLIVAHTVNSVCRGLPGAPKATALSDGWLLTGPSGAGVLCPTVDALWTAVVGRAGDVSRLELLAERLRRHAADPANEGLPARAARSGVESIRRRLTPDGGELERNG